MDFCTTGWSPSVLPSQKWPRKIVNGLSPTRRNFLRRFCEAMSGFAKLLSPKGKLWIVALLLGGLQMHFYFSVSLLRVLMNVLDIIDDMNIYDPYDCNILLYCV